jgi:SMC interacting uncharacterized protein involved in chromosome segregation
MSDELTDDELAEMERRANRVVEAYQGVGGYDEGVWQIECNRYNLASDIPKLIAEVRRLKDENDELLGWVHSCPKCGEKCKECRCVEAELAALREKLRRLEGAEAENASLD